MCPMQLTVLFRFAIIKMGGKTKHCSETETERGTGKETERETEGEIARARETETSGMQKEVSEEICAFRLAKQIA